MISRTLEHLHSLRIARVLCNFSFEAPLGALVERVMVDWLRELPCSTRSLRLLFHLDCLKYHRLLMARVLAGQSDLDAILAEAEELLALLRSGRRRLVERLCGVASREGERAGRVVLAVHDALVLRLAAPLPAERSLD